MNRTSLCVCRTLLVVMLVLNLHPYMMGQPYRLKYLDQILAHICGQGGVWKATGAEIVDWYSRQRGA